jgi:hypothetical protein
MPGWVVASLGNEKSSKSAVIYNIYTSTLDGLGDKELTADLDFVMEE